MFHAASPLLTALYLRIGQLTKDQNINNAFFEAEDNKKVMFKGKNALANKGKVKIIPRKDEKKKQII